MFDTHVNLHGEAFAEDLEEVLTRARTSGVSRFLAICDRFDNFPAVHEIAAAHDDIWCSVGVHPHHAKDFPELTAQDLIEAAKSPKVVGIGETGLDYHYTAESADIQQQSLRVHIEAARRTRLPLIIHSRDADDDMARILTMEHRAGAYDCVMHCFSSGRALAEAALDLGFYLSMPGIAAFPKSTELRGIFADAPVERILVETDSPYLAPPPHRGKRNEPAYTVHTAQVGAGIFGMDYADFAAQTQANFERLFNKAARYGAA